MRLKKALLAGLVVMLTLSGCAITPTETLYHKIDVTLNLSWEVDKDNVVTDGTTPSFFYEGAGVAELTFIFEDNGEALNKAVAKGGYVYFTNYTFADSPCTITIPSERMDPYNQDEWVNAKYVSLSKASDGSYTLSFGGFEYLDSPLPVTMDCGIPAAYTYDDTTADHMLFGNLSEDVANKKNYTIYINMEPGTVYTQSYSDEFEDMYIHNIDITATYLGTYTKEELGDFTERTGL